MAGILLNIINVFRRENLALFTVTRIHCIRKSTKNRNSETGWNPEWKAAENSRTQTEKCLTEKKRKGV